LHDRSVYRCGKLFRILHPAESFCPLGGGMPIMLVGDSDADAIKISFARAAQKRGWGVYLPVDNEPLLTNSLSADWLKREADARGVRWVFLHYAQANFTPELVEQARRALGGRLVVIEPIPEFSESVPKALYLRERPDTLWRSAALLTYLTAHPDIPVIKLQPALCPGGCRLADDAGRPLYFDNRHLTLTGARQLEPIFDGYFDRLDERH
jgi:hypothetical protein